MSGENDVDPKHHMTASVKQCTGFQPSLRSKASRNYPIAVQDSAGRAIPNNVTIKEDVNGYLVLDSAREQLSQAIARGRYQRLAGSLLMSIIVGTAKIRQVYSTVSFRHLSDFPIADVPGKRSYTFHHQTHLHHHLASISRTSSLTPCSRKLFTTPTYGSIQDISLKMSYHKPAALTMARPSSSSNKSSPNPKPPGS